MTRPAYLDHTLSKADKQDLAVIAFMLAALTGAAISVGRYLRLVLK